jgi:hypothetical protein
MDIRTSLGLSQQLLRLLDNFQPNPKTPSNRLKRRCVIDKLTASQKI